MESCTRKLGVQVDLAVLALARDGDDQVDRGDEIALLVRLDHHGSPVIADGEVVVVAR